MLVAYSITNGLTTSDMEQTFTANENCNTPVLTVCNSGKYAGDATFLLGCMY